MKVLALPIVLSCFVFASCRSSEGDRSSTDLASITDRDDVSESASCTKSIPENDGYSFKIVFSKTEIGVFQQSRSARFAPLKYSIIEKLSATAIPQDMEPKFACSKSSGEPNFDTLGLAVYDGYASLRRSSINARFAPVYYKIVESGPVRE